MREVFDESEADKLRAIEHLGKPFQQLFKGSITLSNVFRSFISNFHAIISLVLLPL
jgi:hypothetical protein